MTEIWRDIKGYELLYQVSNLGNVKSLKFGKERILKPTKRYNRYMILHLCKDNVQKLHYVHILVAQAFLPNPNNLPVVNHKDEDPSNNNVTNLEWCTQQYNVEYSIAKAVNQYSVDGEFIRQWASAIEYCKSIGKPTSRINVTRCCQGKQKYAYGFKWYYADDPVQYIDKPLW